MSWRRSMGVFAGMVLLLATTGCPTNNVCCSDAECPGANVCNVDCKDTDNDAGHCGYRCIVDLDCPDGEVCNAAPDLACGCQDATASGQVGSCTGDAGH